MPGLRVATPAEILSGAAAPAALVVLTAPGHRLVPGALDAIAAAFTADPGLGALYGDAVVLGGRGEPRLPVLRPAFDPDYLLAADPIGPVVAVRRPVLDRLGLDPALPGAEVADLLLRLAAENPQAIRHLPRLLSTWSPFAATPPEGWARSRRTLAERHLAGAGHVEARGGIQALRRDLPTPPLASLIIPTRDRVELLQACIESIRAQTDWPALEIIVCDNDSRHPRTLAYFRRLEGEGVRVLPCPGPFNFAAMNNRAADEARGGLLVFVNNDVVAHRPDWLRRMAEEALRPEIGAVGAKLLDVRERIQHCGIVLGTGGLVTHAHRHFPGTAPAISPPCRRRTGLGGDGGLPGGGGRQIPGGRRVRRDHLRGRFQRRRSLPAPGGGGVPDPDGAGRRALSPRGGEPALESGGPQPPRSRGGGVAGAVGGAARCRSLVPSRLRSAGGDVCAAQGLGGGSFALRLYPREVIPDFRKSRDPLSRVGEG